MADRTRRHRRPSLSTLDLDVVVLVGSRCPDPTDLVHLDEYESAADKYLAVVLHHRQHRPHQDDPIFWHHCGCGCLIALRMLDRRHAS